MSARKLVLVADADQSLCARAADAIVDACGVEAARAADGASALEQWALRAPDLLVLAPDLPVIDGVAVARRARTGNSRPPVPVVFTGAVPEGVTRPGDAVLARPLDMDALTAAAREVLGTTAEGG